MFSPVIDLVFPRACLSCGAPEFAFLCTVCEAVFPWIERRCLRCGLPAARDGPACRDCVALEPAFVAARAPARYEGAARDALIAFKLGGERRAGRHLASRMLSALPIEEPDLVVAVPSTRRSMAERGFNQAEELARPVSRALNRPFRRALRKVSETADQAGLGRQARRSNLARAFVSAPIAGDVLLVDDVLTTGATADACAAALLAGGAARVWVSTFARAGLTATAGAPRGRGSGQKAAPDGQFAP